MTNGKITTKEVYELVNQTRIELKADIVRLEVSVNENHKSNEKRIDSLDNQLSSFRGRVYGVVGVIAFLISTAIGMIGLFLKRLD